MSQMKAGLGIATVLAVSAVMGVADQAEAAVSYGSRGYKVAAVQYQLKQKGYFHANITGYYGAITKHAVKAFQRDHGLTADGMIGPATKRALGMKKGHKVTPISYHHKHSCYSSCVKPAHHGLGVGSRGHKVTRVQSRLAHLGYFCAKRTGYFGPITKNAVKSFQRANGLPATGYVGSQTMYALGL
ncbi:MAG: peptidoglycan-binding domain-containing protein, partial [Microcoleaceae cyanobacterium]